MTTTAKRTRPVYGSVRDSDDSSAIAAAMTDGQVWVFSTNIPTLATETQASFWERS